MQSTTDNEQITKWWREFPEALPGIDLNKTHFIVIDADQHGGPDGVAELERLLEKSGRDTFTVTTPRGRHLYYKQPPERLGNSSGALLLGIDVRGAGGYVIAPNTRTRDGKIYQTAGLSLEAAMKAGSISPLPISLATMIKRRPSIALPAFGTRASPANSANRKSALRQLELYVQEISAAKRGERNIKLNACAYSLGRMIGSGWIDEKAVRLKLTSACRLNGLFREDPKGVAATITSGITAGSEAPHPNLSRLRTQNAAGAGLKIVRAADVLAERVEWIWRGRIARGKHTTIAGEPGTAKSLLSSEIAASVSRGRNWPCGEGKAPMGSVIVLSAEDGVADTIVPRLKVAGADLSRVHIIKATVREDGQERGFDLSADARLLEEKVREFGDVQLIIIDPITAYLGTKLDAHKNAEVRGALAPLSDMAERTRTAILSITHLNKSNGKNHVKALDRIIGSIAFSAAPRMAFFLIPDRNDPNKRLLLHGKNNLAKPPQGLSFRIVPTRYRSITAPKVDWSAFPEATTADAELQSRPSKTSRKSQVGDFLTALLQEGPMRVGDIEARARRAGLLAAHEEIGQSKPFRSARDQLGVKVRQTPGIRSGGWQWSLPPPAPPGVGT